MPSNPLSPARLSTRARHPMYRSSWRWLVTQRSAGFLLAWTFGVLTALSALLAALQTLSTPSPAGYGERFSHMGVFSARTFTIFRSLISADQYPQIDGDAADHVLATVAAGISLLIPALVIAVVFVRIYSVNAFIWRQEASICLPWEVDDEEYRNEKEGTHHATLAVRFYKRLKRLNVSDLRCEAYIRFLEPSRVDGVQLIRTFPLEVLGPTGKRTTTRTWPVSREGTTFTLWIPLDAELDGRTVRTIQGIDVTDSALQSVLVRISGKVGGLGVDVFDEHWYSLTRDRLQIGRFARVDVDLTKDGRTWSGWDRFEEPMRQALFVYGRLVDPEALRSLYGHTPRPGVDYVRARIRDFRRGWSVASDNTDAGRRFAYLDPQSGEVVPKQVLFLNLEGAPGAVTEGVLLRVDSVTVAELDGPDGNFTVEDVTGLVEWDAEFADGPPDVVRTYLGRPTSINTARRGLRDGTAVIADEFLKEVQRGMSSYDIVLKAAFQGEPRPEVPVVPLVRRWRGLTEGVATSQYPEQG